MTWYVLNSADQRLGSYETADREEEWWGKNNNSIYSKAYPDKIIFKIIKEDASAYLALKNQDIVLVPVVV